MYLSNRILEIAKAYSNCMYLFVFFDLKISCPG